MDKLQNFSDSCKQLGTVELLPHGLLWQCPMKFLYDYFPDKQALFDILF